MNSTPNLNPNPDVPNILVPSPTDENFIINLPFKPATTSTLKYAVYLFRNKDENEMAKNVQKFGKMDTWILTDKKIVDMSGLFVEFEFDNVNDIISGWKTPNVRNMSYMFYNCTNFNQSLEEWDVQNVTNMSYMFYNCTNFNQSLEGWDVQNVTNISYMFYNCSIFNQPLNDWFLYDDYDESFVTNMSYMFYNCVSFNQDLEDWKVGNATNMSNMFYNCVKFNQPLTAWNVDNVTNMSNMFYNCSSFNQDINDWNVENVANMSNVFYNCFEFNEPLNWWDVEKVVDMTNMFYNCIKFNQSLTDWHVSPSCVITGMFSFGNLTTNKYPPDIKDKLIAQLPRGEKRRLELLLQPQQTNPFKNQILDKVTATPIVLSNSPIATLTPQTTMYNSIELENINVVKYLKENANNLVFYYNNAFYPINKTNLFSFTADGNKVKFKCNQVYSILYITPDKYDIANPYLMGSSFSCPCGLLLLSQIKTILNSPDQLFEIISAGTTAPSTVSYQMTTPQANAVGASHCQEGQGANINTIVKHTIPDFPENLQEDAMDVVPEIENTIGVNYKDITYKFEITPETTVGEFKQMVLDKLVLENQIDNVNKKVRFLYSGKIIQEDSLLLLQIPNVAFGVTFNVLISPNVAGGKLTRRIKRRGKRRVTKKISRRKKTRRLKKIRHKKTKTRR